jgi:DNA-binding HxlR family transcriptional regulator
MHIMYITRQFIKPVKINKPVDTHITILRLLLPNQLSVNQLYKQTGLSYKQRVTRAIKDLEKTGLVKRVKDTNHAQRKYIQLTQLGIDLALIQVDVDNYIESYYQIDRILKKFFMPDLSTSGKPKYGILRSRGLSDNEIKYYDLEWKGIIDILFTLEEKMIDAIIIRFIHKILRKHPNLSFITTEIMNSIFMDVARFRISEMFADYKDPIKISDNNITFDDNMYELLETVEGNNDDDYVPFVFFGTILNEVVNALTNYLLLIRPHPSIIKSKLKTLLINSQLSQFNPKGLAREVIIKKMDEVEEEVEQKFADVLSNNAKLPTHVLGYIPPMESYKSYLAKVNSD